MSACGHTLLFVIIIMEIIVLTKQVKFGDDVKCDFAGIEAAIRLKKKTDAHIHVFVMGEEKSGMAQVRDAIAMGADVGTVLAFKNGVDFDSWVCAKFFADHIKDKKFDIILSGCFPVDADTIQTGLLTGNMLGLDTISHVEEIDEGSEKGHLTVKKRMEDRLQLIDIRVPCMLSAWPHPEAPIYKTVSGINRAYSSDIPVFSLDSSSQIGKIKVKDCFKVGERKRGTCLTAVSTDTAVKTIIDKITAHHVL